MPIIYSLMDVFLMISGICVLMLLYFLIEAYYIKKQRKKYLVTKLNQFNNSNVNKGIDFKSIKNNLKDHRRDSHIDPDQLTQVKHVNLFK